MAISNSYVSLPEGTWQNPHVFEKKIWMKAANISLKMSSAQHWVYNPIPIVRDSELYSHMNIPLTSHQSLLYPFSS